MSGCSGHNITNSHAVSAARAVGARMVLNSNAYVAKNLMDEAAARIVALGAGMTKEETKRPLHITSYETIRHIS